MELILFGVVFGLIVGGGIFVLILFPAITERRRENARQLQAEESEHKVEQSDPIKSDK